MHRPGVRIGILAGESRIPNLSGPKNGDHRVAFHGYLEAKCRRIYRKCSYTRRCRKPGGSSNPRSMASLRGEHVLQPVASSLLRSEGIASSRIEGEAASTQRVFEADYADDAVSDHQVKRIVNSIRVMRDVTATASDGVSSDTFDRWHQRLF